MEILSAFRAYEHRASGGQHIRFQGRGAMQGIRLPTSALLGRRDDNIYVLLRPRLRTIHRLRDEIPSPLLDGVRWLGQVRVIRQGRCLRLYVPKAFGLGPICHGVGVLTISRTATGKPLVLLSLPLAPVP